MEYKYFVSYFYTSNMGLAWGIGNCEIIRDKKILTFEDIKEMIAEIEKTENIGKVTIINYKLFGADENG